MQEYIYSHEMAMINNKQGIFQTFQSIILLKGFQNTVDLNSKQGKLSF
jgi:hypothetical protein